MFSGDTLFVAPAERSIDRYSQLKTQISAQSDIEDDHSSSSVLNFQDLHVQHTETTHTTGIVVNKKPKGRLNCLLNSL